jgi:hypothetical protein
VRFPRSFFCLLTLIVGISANVSALPAAHGNPGRDGAVAASMADDSVASVSGTVTDPSGKAIVGATVSITNASGISQPVVTDKQGRYWVGGLAGGTYKISVAAKGFKDFQVADVALVNGDVVPLDVVLEPGKSATLDAAAGNVAKGSATTGATTANVANGVPTTGATAPSNVPKSALPTGAAATGNVANGLATTSAAAAGSVANGAATTGAATAPNVVNGVATTGTATTGNVANGATTTGAAATGNAAKSGVETSAAAAGNVTSGAATTGTAATADVEKSAATTSAGATANVAKGATKAAVAKSAAKKTAKPASMSGMVTDMVGTAIPGASVSVANDAGFHQTAVADAKGNYALSGLPPGTYDVSASAPGFKAFQAPGVMLAAGDSIPLDATLESEKASAATSAEASGLPASNSQAAPEVKSSEQNAAANVPAQPASESSQTAVATTNADTLAAVLNVAPVIPSAPPGATAVVLPSRGAGQSQGAVTATVIHDGKSAAISGTVTDQTGAVLAGATVTITNSAGFKQTTTSNGQGVYGVSGLPPGTYDVSVSAPNFKGFQAPGVTLAAGDSVPLDASLEPGGEKTEVNVEAGGAAQVQTENAEVSGTVTQKEVSTLQLNGRNFTQLITLTPGVSNQTGQDEAKVGVQGSVKYSVNGGRVEYNSFEVDGSDVLNAGLSGAESTLMVYPSLDAIQEVKVLTSNYGAQYGRTASGTVQVTTKSGGNQWHGNAYEFFRNEAMNARNYFDQTKEAPLYRRNDFGGTIGGPLWIPGHYNLNKDKTFIFFSLEFRYEKSPSELQPNFNQAVPTLAERSGNFSDVCPNPNDPEDLKKLVNLNSPGNYIFPIASYPDCPGVPNGTATAGYRLLFSNTVNGNILYNNLANSSNPHAGLDPNGVAILNSNLIPLPNSFSGCNSSLVGQFDHTTGQLIMPCYDAVISEPTHWREELFRIDHNFTPRLRGTFRYINDSWDTITPTPNWGTVKNSFPTVQNKFVGPGVDVLVRLTQAITPSLLNEVIFSYSDSHITLTDVNGPGGANFQRPAGLGNPNQVGQTSATCPSPTGVDQCPMGYVFNNGFGNKVPGLVLTGNNQAYGGAGFAVDPSYMPWDHTNPTYNVRDDLSKVVGKHTLQFGAQYVLAQRNETNGALGAATGDTQGLLTVSNVNGGLLNTGNAFANFLYNAGNSNFYGGANTIKSYTQDSTQLRYYYRYQTAEPFVQDDWKVSPRLTLNLGVRFSLFGNWHEKYLQAYNWEPQAFSQTLAAQVKVDPYTGQLLGLPGGAPIPLNLGNLDPRITNGIVQCGVKGVPAGCIQNHVFNPAPRVGVAWDPTGTGKTSIRAGYGIFFEHGTGDEANAGSLEGSAPDVLNLTQPFPTGYACIGNYGPTCNENGGVSRPGAYPINVTAIPTQTKYSYSQQWSLSVQREFPKDFVGTFAYVGSKGTHLTVERQLNQLQPISSSLNPFALHEPFLLAVPGSSQADCDNLGTISNPLFILQNGVAVSSNNPASINMQVACQGQSSNSALHPPIATTNVFRPYPGLGEIFSLQNGADSSYQGFQATGRRTKGPLTVGVAYSFSHSIDDSSDRTDPTFVNSLDLRSNKASSNFDQRHLLNISYIYTLPNLSGILKRWTEGAPGDPVGDGQEPPVSGAPSRFQRLLGDGWQWSGITIFQSGTPFSVINNAGSSGIGVLDNAGVANGVGAGSFPDLASSPAPAALKSNPSSFGPLLLNPNEFVAPRGLTFGDVGRNFLNNPNRWNFDMSLLKHFPIREGSEVEFRVEAFNIFNHTQFRLYNPDLGNTGSNTISCYGGANYSAGAYFPGGSDCLTGSSFLHPVDAHRARTMQLALKYSF